MLLFCPPYYSNMYILVLADFPHSTECIYTTWTVTESRPHCTIYENKDRKAIKVKFLCQLDGFTSLQHGVPHLKYLHIHAYIHSHIHTYTHTPIHTYTDTHINTYTHTHTHTHIHIYTHIYIHTFSHTHI